jgi:hypothetical protein
MTANAGRQAGSAPKTDVKAAGGTLFSMADPYKGRRDQPAPVRKSSATSGKIKASVGRKAR